jgi:hypothetical protein
MSAPAVANFDPLLGVSRLMLQATFCADDAGRVWSSLCLTQPLGGH